MATDMQMIADLKKGLTDANELVEKLNNELAVAHNVTEQLSKTQEQLVTEKDALLDRIGLLERENDAKRKGTQDA